MKTSDPIEAAIHAVYAARAQHALVTSGVYAAEAARLAQIEASYFVAVDRYRLKGTR